ncbi:MmcB family DNA repair protein [Blastomonas sp.]|uniref:MmcB family DNA repair protein n=1 Tax=Blastomonas sp. TaxID=1909299 RepID=UPI00261F934E|nr:MmcB family DNA repair protein [Blastomonas sp.]MDM7955949.1 MmcB family DNA repair protein [Blastomonas sp.]
MTDAVLHHMSVPADTQSLQAPIDSCGPPQGAAAVARGIARLFRRNQIWVAPEIALPNGRRADLMGIDSRGAIVIVEIKVARADLLGDAKWPEYLDHCDRFYWGLPPTLDSGLVQLPAFLPETTGLIIADAYDAEIIRPASTRPLAPARRKSETARLACVALRRLNQLHDPAPPDGLY